MNRQTWAQDYADLVGKMNKVRVTLERVKDRNGKFWGTYSIVNADTGMPMVTFDYKKAKLALGGK